MGSTLLSILWHAMNCDDIFFQHHTDWPLTCRRVNIINLHIHIHRCTWFFAIAPCPNFPLQFLTGSGLSRISTYLPDLSLYHHSQSLATSPLHFASPLCSSPWLLLCPRLPLHRRAFWIFFILIIQPFQHCVFRFLTARLLHGFGVQAGVMLPMTRPRASWLHEIPFFFLRPAFLDARRYWVDRPWRWDICFFYAFVAGS